MLSHYMPSVVLCVGPRGASDLWVTGDGCDHMAGSCHKVKGHWSGSAESPDWDGPLGIV